MMEQLIRPFIPVNSFVHEPAIAIETAPEPNIGIRWGKPSQFIHSNQGKKPSRRFTFEQPDDDDDNELAEEVEIVKLTGKSLEHTVQFVDDVIIQMTSTLHFTGRRIVERYDSQGRRQLPGEIEINYYFDLTLNGP